MVQIGVLDEMMPGGSYKLLEVIDVPQLVNDSGIWWISVDIREAF